MGIQGEFFEREPLTEKISSAPIATPVVTGVVTAAGPEPASTRRMMKDLSIPKLYYSISEVSRLTGVEPYILRYWENEFEELHPQKNRAGNRIYSNRDIKFILRVKELLREKRYTIDGAKHIVRGERIVEARSQGDEGVAATSESLQDPDQIPLPTEAVFAHTPLTLEDIRRLKSTVEELRSLLGR